MARSMGSAAFLVVALALLASAPALGRRELLQSPAGASTSPSTSPAASTSPSPAGSTSPSTSPSTTPSTSPAAAAAAAKPASPAASTSPSPAQAASSPQAAAAQSPAAAAKAPAAAAQSPASGAQSPAAAAVAPAQAQTPGSAPAPGQPGNTVINNNNNNNNQNTNVNINNNNNNNNNPYGGNPAIVNNNNNNNNNGQPLPQGATFQPGPGASAAGPAVTGGSLVGGPSGGGVSSGGSQGGSSGGSAGGSSGGSSGSGSCPPLKDGLTVTEQFLAQVCNAQSARFNGQNIASSLLQSSSSKTDNALICCVACLDSSSCSAWNYQAGGQNAYDGTAPGTCQLVSGTKGGSDTLASGSGQPFIGGVLARTNP